MPDQSAINKIYKMKSYFRLLKKWKIRYAPATENEQAIVAFNCNRKRTAIIYGFGEPEIPEDYYLHEVLHCAFKELTSIDRRKPKELREAEELLIQDICKIVYPHNLKKKFNNNFKEK